MQRWRLVFLLGWLAAWSSCAKPSGIDVLLPASPTQWVTDNGAFLSPQGRETINALLEEFEHETKAQVLVYTEPELPKGIDIDDYALRSFNKWAVGQEGRNNGVILFIFPTDQKLRLEIGLGLEDVLSNETCSNIINNVIVPRIQAGDHDDAVRAGIEQIFARIRMKHGSVRNRTHTPTPEVVRGEFFQSRGDGRLVKSATIPGAGPTSPRSPPPGSN